MDERVDLAVIGAGPAGLCAAWHAERRGWRTVVVDRGARPGGSWLHADPAMRCLSPRARDQLPDGSKPAGAGSLASAAEVVDWLDAFARRLTAQMLANTAVDRVVRAGGGFELLSVHGALRAQRVIVATGEHGRPRWPAVPIAAGAPLVHAASLPQRAFRAADRVVVIGGGNSAAQVARGAVERGASVVVSVRRWPDRPAWMRAAGQLVRWSGGLVVRPVAEARWWLSGLPVAWLPRRGGCLAAVPLEDPWLVEAARSGRLQVVPATAAVEAGGVRLVDGRVVAADHIVAATGYLRETGCVAGLAECDGDGFPQHRNGRSLAVPGLAFVGLPCMRTRRSGFLRGFAEDAAAVVNALG